MSEHQEPRIHSAQLRELQAGGDAKSQRWIERNLELIKNVRVGVTARLGATSITVSRLFELKEGETLALDNGVDEPVDLLVEGSVVARGKIVVVGDTFGIRVTEIVQSSN